MLQHGNIRTPVGFYCHLRHCGAGAEKFPFYFRRGIVLRPQRPAVAGKSTTTARLFLLFCEETILHSNQSMVKYNAAATKPVQRNVSTKKRTVSQRLCILAMRSKVPPAAAVMP